MSVDKEGIFNPDSSPGEQKERPAWNRPGPERANIQLMIINGDIAGLSKFLDRSDVTDEQLGIFLDESGGGLFSAIRNTESFLLLLSRIPDWFSKEKEGRKFNFFYKVVEAGKIELAAVFFNYFIEQMDKTDLQPLFDFLCLKSTSDNVITSQLLQKMVERGAKITDSNFFHLIKFEDLVISLVDKGFKPGFEILRCYPPHKSKVTALAVEKNPELINICDKNGQNLIQIFLNDFERGGAQPGDFLKPQDIRYYVDKGLNINNLDKWGGNCLHEFFNSISHSGGRDNYVAIDGKMESIIPVLQTLLDVGVNPGLHDKDGAEPWGYVSKQMRRTRLADEPSTASGSADDRNKRAEENFYGMVDTRQRRLNRGEVENEFLKKIEEFNLEMMVKDNKAWKEWMRKEHPGQLEYWGVLEEQPNPSVPKESVQSPEVPKPKVDSAVVHDSKPEELGEAVLAEVGVPFEKQAEELEDKMLNSLQKLCDEAVVFMADLEKKHDEELRGMKSNEDELKGQLETIEVEFKALEEKMKHAWFANFRFGKEKEDLEKKRYYARSKLEAARKEYGKVERRLKNEYDSFFRDFSYKKRQLEEYKKEKGLA